jgi:RimJ/RimL family protein N-acetyltransferase
MASFSDHPKASLPGSGGERKRRRKPSRRDPRAATANPPVCDDSHSALEMRHALYDKNARMLANSIEFAVLLLSTGQLIGFGGMFDISQETNATLFVGVGEREHWGKDLGAEATRLICEYGFFFRSLHSIKVEVNGYNRQAIRVYERLGFKPVGRLRDAIVMNGNRYDRVIMDLLRHELTLEHVARFQSLERD